MEHKTFQAFETKVLDEDQGVVESIIAVMGVIDEGKDIIHPGGFTKSIAERGLKVRVLDQHQTGSVLNVVGKPLEIREVSRAELPAETLAKYPEATGGLFTKTQFLLGTPEGRGVFERIKSGAVGEWSIGYDSLDKDFSKAKTPNGEEITVRNLRTVRLWEYSPVIWGMNPATTTTYAKSANPTEEKPWKVIREDDMWRVYKLDAEGEPTGDPVGEHETEEDAEAQVRALYANVEDEKPKKPAKAGRRMRGDKRELLDKLVELLTELRAWADYEDAEEEEEMEGEEYMREPADEKTAESSPSNEKAGPPEAPTSPDLLKLIDLELEQISLMEV